MQTFHSDNLLPPTRRDGRRTAQVLLLSFVFPPLLLWEAWKTPDERYRHWLGTLFFLFYGATITIAFDPSGQGADGVRHLLTVYTHYVGLSFSDFISQLGEILLFQVGDAGSRDVYKHVVSYVVGGVLGMPWLFFPVIATVYGYFFVGSMLIIFRNWGRVQLPLVVLFLIAIFFLLKNIEGVNTVRTWTGLWVLTYGVLRYLETRRLRYLVLMAMPPFIHFGYFLMVLPAFAAIFLGNRTTLIISLFALSSFTTFINPGQMTEIIATTERGESSIQGYYREDVVDAGTVLETNIIAGNRIWLALQRAGVQKWALLVFVYTLLIAGVYQTKMTRLQKSLFSVGLLMITMSNSTWYLFAVSNRTWIIGAVFLMAAFTMWRLSGPALSLSPSNMMLYRFGLYLSAVLFLPYFLYNLSTIMDYPSVFLLGFPFMAWIDPSLNMSIKEAVRFVVVDLLPLL